MDSFMNESLPMKVQVHPKTRETWFGRPFYAWAAIIFANVAAALLCMTGIRYNTPQKDDGVTDYFILSMCITSLTFYGFYFHKRDVFNIKLFPATTISVLLLYISYIVFIIYVSVNGPVSDYPNRDKAQSISVAIFGVLAHMGVYCFCSIIIYYEQWMKLSNVTRSWIGPLLILYVLGYELSRFVPMGAVNIAFYLLILVIVGFMWRDHRQQLNRLGNWHYLIVYGNAHWAHLSLYYTFARIMEAQQSSLLHVLVKNVVRLLLSLIVMVIESLSKYVYGFSCSNPFGHLRWSFYWRYLDDLMVVQSFFVVKEIEIIIPLLIINFFIILAKDCGIPEEILYFFSSWKLRKQISMNKDHAELKKDLMNARRETISLQLHRREYNNVSRVLAVIVVLIIGVTELYVFPAAGKCARLLCNDRDRMLLTWITVTLSILVCIITSRGVMLWKIRRYEKMYAVDCNSNEGLGPLKVEGNLEWKRIFSYLLLVSIVATASGIHGTMKVVFSVTI
ncbi:hypothetical protein BKA69DRAFT_1127522 [Paraphysoderma sedebokerense]|nr:hypothetical protein BKA69DRAFT_1127522 [Paraphysoderma sedebokerense]